MIFFRISVLVIIWNCFYALSSSGNSGKLDTSVESVFFQTPFDKLDPSVLVAAGPLAQINKRFKRQPTFLTRSLIKPLIKRTTATKSTSTETTSSSTPPALQKFQVFVTNAKKSCGNELGFTQRELQKSFIQAQNLTKKEKCLLLCILKRTKIMDKKNKLSVNTLGRIANIISNNNALVASIAVAAGEKCNRKVMNIEDPCETAYQISRCIANELKTHALKIFY